MPRLDLIAGINLDATEFRPRGPRGEAAAVRGALHLRRGAAHLQFREAEGDKKTI